MKPLRKPLISIIVPSYNQGEFIENCILSILEQSFERWELIIQDGKSSDSTAQICNKYVSLDNRINFFSEPDSGFADAVNKALSKCRGELIGIQSSDDFYASKNVFSEVATIYAAYPSLNIISGRASNVNHDLKNIIRPVSCRETGFLPPETVFILKNHFPQSATFFSLSRAKHVGGLDPDLDIVADTDFWVRMASYFPVNQNVIYSTSQVWGCVTLHLEQRSSDLSKFVEGRARMAIKHLEDERFDLGKQLKYRQAASLVDYGMRYFEYSNLDCSIFDSLYSELFSKPLPIKRHIKRYIKMFPLIKTCFCRNIKYEISALTRLDIYPIGYSMKWFQDEKNKSYSTSIPNKVA